MIDEMKKDSKILGIIMGLIAPVIGMLVYWTFAFGIKGLMDIKILLHQTDKLSALISLGLIANLGGFFLFYRLKLDESARGVILATFLYGFVILILKFVL